MLEKLEMSLKKKINLKSDVDLTVILSPWYDIIFIRTSSSLKINTSCGKKLCIMLDTYHLMPLPKKHRHFVINNLLTYSSPLNIC